MNKHHTPKPYDAPQNATSYTDRQLSPRLRAGLRITDGGRLVIPAVMREAMGVGPGDTVSAICVNGELRLVSPEMALKNARRRLTKSVGADASMVDELIAGRREAAQIGD